MSSAFLPEFSSSGSRWGTRNSVSEFAALIKEAWNDQRKHVFFLGSYVGTWSMMALTGFGSSQSYIYDSDISKVKKWVSDKWDLQENWAITSWCVNDDTHFVIMTQNPIGMCSSCSQTWATRSSWSEMRDWIKSNFAEGHIITDASYSVKKKQYVAVMTKSSKGQVYKVSKEFPKEWVKQQWAAGKTITKVLHDGDPSAPWLVTATSDMGTSNSWSIGLGCC